MLRAKPLDLKHSGLFLPVRGRGAQEERGRVLASDCLGFPFGVSEFGQRKGKESLPQPCVSRLKCPWRSFLFLVALKIQSETPTWWATFCEPVSPALCQGWRNKGARRGWVKPGEQVGEHVSECTPPGQARSSFYTFLAIDFNFLQLSSI